MKRFVLDLLRVPATPDPPPGAPGSLRTFRAASRFYHYEIFLWLTTQIGGLIGLLFGISMIEAIPPDTLTRMILSGLEIVAWTGYVINLPVTFYLVRLDYEMRWYMVTDRSLRIREGILRVKEKTMTFANIQNLSVRQGPIQRFLGIEDLEVQTAGGGSRPGQEGKSEGEAMHLAKFRGVDNAEEIRELIRDGMKHHADSGLGDPEERSRRAAGSGNVVEAAQEALREARELRRAIG
ncbi:MAG: PH domain-containing protein [Thermoanaerobaculia bacterium]|nr:PH domain-containing protein [Thermoanaerobaculia bacterium]